MEQKSNSFLKVTGILMIIGGSINIILGIVALLGVGMLAALGANSVLLTLSAVLVLVSAVVSLIAGIFGVKNAAKPEKAQTCIVSGILAAIFAVLGNVLSMAGGGSFNFVGLLTGLALPVLYLVGAFQSKKLAV